MPQSRAGTGPVLRHGPSVQRPPTVASRGALRRRHHRPRRDRQRHGVVRRTCRPVGDRPRTLRLGGHHHGASHDHSRIIRHSYHTEHYVRPDRRAYDAWREVEAESGETCVHITGGIDLFPPGAAIDIDDVPRPMRRCGVAFDELTPAEVTAAGRRGTSPPTPRCCTRPNTGHRLAGGDRAVDATPGDGSRRHAPRRHARFAAIEPAGDAGRHPPRRRQRRCGPAQVVVAADAWTAALLAPLGTSCR